MIQSWKIQHMVKGGLTLLPMVNTWRQRHVATGGSDSARYCYTVWFRHLMMLSQYGFQIRGAHIGELGPGDSIGTGLMALLSGAESYTGLDVVPYSAQANLSRLFAELVQLYGRREAIPDDNEFPKVRPRLARYDFPVSTVEWPASTEKIARVQACLRSGVNSSQMVSYIAPWTSENAIAAASLDLLFSQGVLQQVDTLKETYQAMFAWLKPGGYASHTIGCWAAYLSPYWNGLWAYDDWQWRLVRGRREYLFNREPLSTHLRYATNVGFEVVAQVREYGNDGLPLTALSRKFQALDEEDLRTRGALVILRKPA